MSLQAHVYERPSLDPQTRSSLSVLAAYVPPGARVLDLGIGGGGLAAHLSRHKACEVDGLTHNPAEAQLAAGAYRKLVVADLETEGWAAQFESGGYDVIVCADVLEHLRAPEQVLQACQALLAPGGLLLVSLPNVAYAGMVMELMHGGWHYGTEGLLDATHLRFFTRSSFETVLAAGGWHLLAAQPIEQPWYETEFHRKWDHVPPVVADYLLAQPHANVYQWVFVAARQQLTLALAQAVPTAPPVSVASYVMQLFVDRGKGFSDRTKVQVLGRMGVSGQTLRFSLPADAEKVRRLRLDPADRPGFWWLRAVVIRRSGGPPLWSWAAGPEAEQVWLRAGGHQVVWGHFDAQRAAHPLHLMGDDPQLMLPVPDAVWSEAAGDAMTLEVHCDWPWSADYVAILRATSEPSVQPPPWRQPATLMPWWRRWRRVAPSTHAVAPKIAPVDPVVEVIVPVYGHWPLVERCLRSVLAATGGVASWHLTVIDDASPDEATRQGLRTWGLAHPEVTVLANVRNLGFVQTVNLGMKLAGRRDVVLLNSDTEVAGDWLDRLRAAAYQRPEVGTVTPFSNNATICSFPRFCEDNALPEGHTTATLHDLVARLCHGQTVDIPTAVGFCMYIRRDCLDQVGFFDADTFGLGYGEENDFCMRATRAGWHHLHALDTFVFHQGGVSFSERRHALQQQALAALLRLHPDYEDRVQAFVRADPARAAREAVSIALGQPVA